MPGRPSRTRSVALDGRLLPFDEWTVDLRSWVGPGRLELTPFGQRHSIRLIRADDGSFLGWYVNLQAPLAESRLGFDTTDWQLDLWIEPAGDIHWKDEDDLEQAVELEILTSIEAEQAREEATPGARRVAVPDRLGRLAAGPGLADTRASGRLGCGLRATSSACARRGSAVSGRRTPGTSSPTGMTSSSSSRRSARRPGSRASPFRATSGR